VSKGYKPAGARANPDSGLDNVSLFNKEKLSPENKKRSEDLQSLAEETQSNKKPVGLLTMQ